MTTPEKKVPLHLQSAQNRLLIKNGTLINADGCQQVDIYTEDHVVKMVGKHLIIPGGTRLIDAAGKLVLPGGVDANVHFQMPTSTEGTSVQGGTRTVDDFYNGTRAAVAGGTTTVIDCVVPEKGESLVKAFAKWRGWGDEHACCDYALRVATPAKITDDVRRDMKVLASDEFGVNAFFFDMAPRGETFSEADLLDAFQECARLGCIAQVLAENQTMVERNTEDLLARGLTGPEGFSYAHSEAAEETATLSAAMMAGQANCPLYVTSMSSASAAKIIRQKKEAGIVLFGETTAAGVGCDGTIYEDPDWMRAAACVTRPPLRAGQSDELISECLGSVEGTGAVDILASNHASYNADQKALGVHNFTKIPAGVNGVEERLSVLWERGVRTGKISAEEFVALTSANPAKIFNMFPEKGRIEVGSHADIVIWNPSAARKFSKTGQNGKSDLNIFDGMECHGIPEYVIVQGRIVVDDGQLRAMQGLGKFVPVSPFSPHVFEKIRQREAAQLKSCNRRIVVRPNVSALTNGSSGNNIPAPSPVRRDQAERAPSQHESSFDLKNHPNGPEVSENGKTPVRVSVKVRAPPGGKSSGGFW